MVALQLRCCPAFYPHMAAPRRAALHGWSPVRAARSASVSHGKMKGPAPLPGPFDPARGGGLGRGHLVPLRSPCKMPRRLAEQGWAKDHMDTKIGRASCRERVCKYV